jgi:sulfatase maturation enzyme AslB (radical SAM superfamily)
MGGLGQVNKRLMPINKNTFCVAPWYSVFIGSDKTLAPCCQFKSKFNNYNKLEKYFNSKEIDDVRQDLLKGIKNKNCSKCWDQEDKGNDSLRLISNRTIGLNTKSSIRDQIKDPKISNIKIFDLTLGNLCNLKCTMCYPGLSSQLLAEANINPKLKSRYGKNYVQENYDWPKYDDFISWCEKFLPQSIQITFTGGEPFIIPWIPNVIKKIPETQKAKCILHFTTNLTVINDELLKIFHKFREVWISVSIEGTGKTHEYVRHGHRWQKLIKNLKLLRDKKIPNLFLKFNHVVQATSYHSITDMVKFADEQKLEIHPALLENPQHFHISALTETAKIKFIEKTADYDGFNKEFVSYVRNMSNTHIKQDKSLAKHCIEHLSDLDEVRNTNFQNIIPKENLYQC